MEKPFKYDKEQLNRLAEVELEIPLRVLKKMEEIGPPKKGEKKDQFISVIELFEGKFLERTFAFRFDLGRKGEERIKRKEVMRKIEGNKYKLYKDIYSTSFGHYVIWEKKTVGRGYYGYGYVVTPENQWGTVDSAHMNLYSTKIYSFEDCVQLDPSIKYCGLNYTGLGMYKFIEYISWFRVMPEIEMYAKNDIMHLVTDSRFYNKMKKSKQFAQYVRKHINQIRRKPNHMWNKYNYPQILKAFKSGEELDSFWKREKFRDLGGYAGNENILTDKVVEKIISKYDDLHLYLDYFNAAKKYIYMDTNQALYPNNLHEAHDYYVEKVKEEERKINEEREKRKIENFLKVSKDCEWLSWDSNHYMIMVTPNIESLINEGQLLHHCVGHMNYDQKMADGGNLIMFVRKIEEPETPFYTVEFDKKTKKIIQCRGDKNASATKEVQEFLDKWIKKIPALKRKSEMRTERETSKLSLAVNC